MAANFKKFFKKNGEHTTEDYCQIINQKHFDRVSGYIASAVSGGASVVFGGRTDKESRFIEPTVLSNVSLESEVMTEEIFGPILPILPYENLDDVVSFINKRHRPLALYVFSSNKKNDIIKKQLIDLGLQKNQIQSQIQELNKSNLVNFGAHTVNHLALNKISKNDIRKEVLDSKLRLELKLQQSIDHFSYPFGSIEEVN